MSTCSRPLGSPWLNLVIPGIFQMVNGRLDAGVLFSVGIILLSPTIIGALMVYMICLLHGFLLREKLG